MIFEDIIAAEIIKADTPYPDRLHYARLYMNHYIIDVLNIYQKVNFGET